METSLKKNLATAIFAAINIIGSYLALSLQLPIYLDTIGTMLAGICYGPLYGALCGLIANIASGILFDTASLFFIPSALLLGFFAGKAQAWGLLDGKKRFLGSLVVSLAPSIVSSIIAAYAFGGITPSGSSLLAQWIHAKGVNLVVAVFATQFVTDYLDKLITISLAKVLAGRIPSRLED